MRLIILVLTFVISYGLFAQAQNPGEIIGIWTVRNIELLEMEGMQLNADEKQGFDVMKNGFKGAMLEFKSDSSCHFLFSEEAPDFIRELEDRQNMKWRYELKNNIIMVGTDKDNYTVIGFYFLKKADKIVFLIAESPFALEVIRK